MEECKLTFVNVGYGEAMVLRCPAPERPGGVFVMAIDGGSAEAEEYADRTAVMDYLAGIQRKMDFAHPFGFSLRDKVEKSRILPTGIYIRDGDYEKFETGHMIVDRDTMAFAKISGVLEPEEPFKDEKSVLAEYKARLDEDFKKNPYPFAVSNRVWIEDGQLNFEIVDVDMMKKMEKREQRSLKESLDMMKAYRVSE